MARSRSLDLLGPFGLLVAMAALVACDSDAPDPAGPGGPEGPDPSIVTLESNQLDAGGTGVVVSDGFAQLELEPAVDDYGAIIPDRWANLHVTVGGTACGPNEPSWACASPPGAQAYDEFLFQLAEALFGQVASNPGNPHASASATSQPSNPGPAAAPTPAPTASATAAPSVSLCAAFNLAVAQDRRPETPTIADPFGLANTLVLV